MWNKIAFSSGFLHKEYRYHNTFHHTGYKIWCGFDGSIYRDKEKYIVEEVWEKHRKLTSDGLTSIYSAIRYGKIENSSLKYECGHCHGLFDGSKNYNGHWFNYKVDKAFYD